ncbi:hypothetical protein VTN31DRAFT_1873 [Thermomyces dupontii]|uniref:uncharacterized protein n=1 Tax=Talaromyces thermophilus TaxID=28565 RepID=UPI0037429569
MAKMKRQIRRTPRDLAEYRVGEKMAADFHDFPEDKDGYSSVVLITDRISQMIWDYYLKDRRSDSIATALKSHLQILERQYGIYVKAIECDNEIYQRRKDVRKYLEDLGIKLEPSAAYTQSQKWSGRTLGGCVQGENQRNEEKRKLPRSPLDGDRESGGLPLEQDPQNMG